MTRAEVGVRGELLQVALLGRGLRPQEIFSIEDDWYLVRR
jgi:hypothetical protein